MDITHDNVCSSMLSWFYSHLLSTGCPISSFVLLTLAHKGWVIVVPCTVRVAAAGTKLVGVKQPKLIQRFSSNF